MSGTSAVAPRLARLLQPVVAGAGCELEELTVTPAGRRQVVRVLVDRDGGVTLDDISDVSRLVSEALDEIDAREPTLLAGAYVLEVSSPGVDRPLTEARHWRRNLGRLATAHLRDGRAVTGRVAEVGETHVLLDDRAGRHRVELGEVARGQVQVEFSRSAAGEGADDEMEEDA